MPVLDIAVVDVVKVTDQGLFRTLSLKRVLKVGGWGSCAGKLCISYSCSTLPLTDFHELLSFSELSDLTTTTTICNTVRPQLTLTVLAQHMTSHYLN